MPPKKVVKKRPIKNKHHRNIKHIMQPIDSDEEERNNEERNNEQINNEERNNEEINNEEINNKERNNEQQNTEQNINPPIKEKMNKKQIQTLILIQWLI